MKKRLTLVVVFGLFITSNAFAGSGSAYLPHFFSEYHSSGQKRPVIYLTNITGSAVDVTVTFFKHDGTVLTETDTTDNYNGGIIRGSSNATGYKDYTAPTGTTVVFTIPAGQQSTTYIEIGTINTVHQGYALIEWKQTGNNLVALIAEAAEYDSAKNDRSYHAINNGLPF
ncbi:hypothetical protein SG34_027885 [Thalassomonas viridans]|uniref:Uncharacterized protein n=1 Tax=Thalassomonas viridans TaxID=137584 RepID=A0AAE9Z2K0_9GAMM|nr:hypothetical protein [Thalassomonas viridans]WDE05077.1 hypothetical protein SG34_027885 [Thalassomonas viridans]